MPFIFMSKIKQKIRKKNNQKSKGTELIKPEILISLIALILSIIATIASIYFPSLGLKTEIMPTLVFIYSPSDGWILRNVGNGPALNIVIAYQMHFENDWQNPTRLYPIAQGEELKIKWVRHDLDKLGVIYSDAYNRVYTSICDDDLTTIVEGRALPTWKDSEIIKVWQLNQM